MLTTIAIQLILTGFATGATLLLVGGSGGLTVNLPPGGNSPATSFKANGIWISLLPDAQHWYAFHDEGDSTSIEVRLEQTLATKATFKVLTPEQVTHWSRGEDYTPVGEGTPNAILGGDLYWTGRFVQSGIYYILVENQQASSGNYKLKIQGEKISFPTELSLVESAAADSIAPSDAQVEHPLLPHTPGSSAENPLPPVGKRSELNVEQRHWYAFRDEGDAASIEVMADSTPSGCINFEIWTPAQLKMWQLGEPFEAVGRGTPNRVLKADLFWTGSFVKSGTYYILVERSTLETTNCLYELVVRGNDVSIKPAPDSQN